MRLRLIGLVAHGLRRAFQRIGSLLREHGRQIERIEPDHRPVAFMAMLVPQQRRRENQIAALHRQLFAVDDGVAALAFHHEAHRARRSAGDWARSRRGRISCSPI